MIPYYDSTDHHAFNPAPIGVPGTSLTNWPDEYIHGTGDDLENIDATQLERNALVVAGVALYFAGLSEEGAPPLAAYVAARGRARTSGDVATAVAQLWETPAAQRDAAYRSGRSLIQQSYRKELLALSSVRRFAATPRARTLHPMMRFEVYNFADGKRSAWDVYEAVAAEALSAGAWYYGRVSAPD